MHSSVVEKTCTKCGLTQSVSEFYSRIPRAKSASTIRTADQRRSDCRTCMKACRERNRKAVPKDVARERLRRVNLKINYGITPEYYSVLFTLQNGKCKICDKPPDGKHLYIDHCHITNRVRGLLCNACNLGLGQFKDRRDLIERALAYITQFDHQLALAV